ncbi:dephospho-CoA kinase [Candidatus Galacturonibacter soehngenii]|uniref:Dephospho-CoA kinase n=1 Tax=Candidatus Galacturonatibacter soehngenii TaxID=2307010 RepID=A0A7V7QND8_9FIRM|nr:dephospho-CoA kinase [Candidatus Galacturonibacter soehngenii]KAB1439938.1 dephospho-CoA kinase [Candidatus Galacturonibacter soehngenii]
MKIIGITGGIGAGKSSVLNYIQKNYNARVIMADQVAHMLEEPGQSCYYSIVEEFGSNILNADMTINRQRLAHIVFEDEKKRLKLNAIVHPKVKEYIVGEIKREREKGKLSFFIIEAALLLEDRYDLICDEVWYIYAHADIRRQRLKMARGYSDDKIDYIMKSQLTEEDFRKKCTVVIDNNSKEYDTQIQIDEALREEH